MNEFQTIQSGQGLLKQYYPNTNEVFGKALKERRNKLLTTKGLDKNVPELKVQERAEENSLLPR